jgi:hypothetical protein
MDGIDFYAEHTARTFVQYYFNQSGEVQAGRILRPVGKEVTDASVIAGIRDQYVAFAKASGNEVAAAWMPVHFDTINSTLRSLEQMRIAAEPAQLEALAKFAARAYRRPLIKAEHDGLIAHYHQLREKGGLSHEDAMRDSVASVLVAPEFFFRIDLQDAPSGSGASAARSEGIGTLLPPYSLASRLSYFLWSSMPDEELLKHAVAGDLAKPEVLAAQTRRMLKDPRARGLAVEFAANWLDSRHFETYNSVDRQRFPSFTNQLRSAMFRGTIRFFEDTIRNNRSVLDMLYGDYTFVNPDLAKHYGIDIPGSSPPVKPAEPVGRRTRRRERRFKIGRVEAARAGARHRATAFADPSVTTDTWVRVDDAGSTTVAVCCRWPCS